MQAKSSLGLDAVALILAGLLHVLLVAALLLQGSTRDPMPEPKRITVNFAEEVGMTSTAPDPTQESQASVAPELGEAAPPPIEYVPPPPLPQPRPSTAPQPRPQPTARETSRPQPRPTARATSQPRPQPRPTSRATSAPRPKPSSEPTRSGGSRVGSDFLAGQGTSSSSNDTRTPADSLGPSAMAALDAAVARAVRAKWQGRVPQGPDAEKLVTRVRFRLNPDGSLAGEPQVVGQTRGVTDLNRNQVTRHQEEAIRAIKLVGRFDLPFPVPAGKTFTLDFDRN